MANKRTNKKWTIQEEESLIKNVKDNVDNLKEAFKQTSLETQRTSKAVTAHWYTHTSIKGGHCLFLTISGHHVAINRKNGKGKKSKFSLYKKVLALLGLNY